MQALSCTVASDPDVRLKARTYFTPIPVAIQPLPTEYPGQTHLNRKKLEEIEVIPSCAEAFNLETIFPKLDAFALTEYLMLRKRTTP